MPGGSRRERRRSVGRVPERIALSRRRGADHFPVRVRSRYAGHEGRSIGAKPAPIGDEEVMSSRTALLVVLRFDVEESKPGSVIQSAIDLKSWIARTPTVAEARPAACLGCEAAELPGRGPDPAPRSRRPSAASARAPWPRREVPRSSIIGRGATAACPAAPCSSSSLGRCCRDGSTARRRSDSRSRSGGSCRRRRSRCGFGSARRRRSASTRWRAG